MLEITSQKFISNAESWLTGAAANDDFLKIKTSAGTAVLLSEAEYQILLDAFQALISYPLK